MQHTGVAPRGGLEPPTRRLEGDRSIQLSYRGVAAEGSRRVLTNGERRVALTPRALADSVGTPNGRFAAVRVVGVAQVVEHRVVVSVAAGSSPVAHPSIPPTVGPVDRWAGGQVGRWAGGPSADPGREHPIRRSGAGGSGEKLPGALESPRIRTPGAARWSRGAPRDRLRARYHARELARARHISGSRYESHSRSTTSNGLDSERSG